MRFLLCVCIVMYVSSALAQVTLPNINLSAAGDLIFPISSESSEDNKLTLRSAEFAFYAPVDHRFDAVLNIAGHDHDGEFIFDLHEGYISTSKLLPSTTIKAGKFFLNVGRLNSFHQHDWPFVTAPKVHREFLSPGSSTLETEGASDTGIESHFLLPIDRFFEISVGVANGYCFGHCHEEGEKPPYPLHYLRATTFFEGENGSGLLLGTSYLGRKSFSNVTTHLFGLDITYKKREGKTLKWLFQNEVYYQIQNDPGADKTRKVGAYFYPQYGISDYLLLGLRFDIFSHLNLDFASTGENRKNLDYAVSPNLTYKSSEFVTLRMSYVYEVETRQGLSDNQEHLFLTQAVFIMGAHPAHDF